MPGVDIGAILSAVGGMLLQALMNALTNTITELLTSAISSAIQGVSDTLEQLFGVNSWLANAIDTFANNLTAELTGAVSNLLNETNRIAQTAWGIVDSQQRLHEQLATIVEGSLGELAHALQMEQEQHYKAGAAFTDFLLQYVAGHEKRMRDFVNDYYAMMQAYFGKEFMTTTDEVEAFWNFVSQYLMADLQVIEAMPREDLTVISEYLAEYARDNIREIRQWFREVVVVPVSFANALRSAFTEGVAYSPDEYAEMLLEHQEAVDKAMAKYMERLERKLQEHGEIMR